MPDPNASAPAPVIDPSAVEHRARIQLHRTLAGAHETYADALEGLLEREQTPAPPAVRGSLQRKIVGLEGIALEPGMTSREVAAKTSGDEPNCHTALKGLAEKGVVEVLDGSPQRFRLAAKHRRHRVLRLSRLLEDGEWTTYGEFGLAVYDNTRMGRTVGQVAAHNPAFANAHRVLLDRGKVSTAWRDEDQDRGPEECKRRLAEEGVWDEGRDRAKEENFVGWAELRRRLESDDGAAEFGATA